MITSEAVRALRESTNETQQGMATRLGLAMSTIYKWEKGRSPELPHLLLLLEVALGTDAETRFLDAVLEAAPVNPETWERIAARSRQSRRKR